jgi:chromosome segregation ATPase
MRWNVLPQRRGGKPYSVLTARPTNQSAELDRLADSLTESRAIRNASAKTVTELMTELDRLRGSRNKLHRRVQRAESAIKAAQSESYILRARLEASQINTDRLRAESAELKEREAERDALHAAVRDDARAALKDALGERLWNELWGPELEALGSVVYEVWRQRQKLQAENERLKSENAASGSWGSRRDSALKQIAVATGGLLFSPEDLAIQVGRICKRVAELEANHGPGKCARMRPPTVRPVFPVSED